MKAARALTAVVLCFALWGCATEPQEDVQPTVDLDFQHYTLPNGLDVILRKDDRVPVASVNIWYDVSPANEPEGLAGLAHLFEHMMLQGSLHAPGDYLSRLQAIGATGVNGNTDLDRTAFLQDVPSNQLELALWAESDRMGFLVQALDEAVLANQKAVVRNERREAIDNAPYGLAQERIYKSLFPPEHPYHGYIYGSHEQIQAAQLDDVEEFYERYYAPSNASLSITGNIDLDRTKELIEKYFGTLPGGPEVEEPSVATPQLDEQIRLNMTDQVELPRVYMAWITPPAFQIGDAEATLAARMLGGGKASRLYKRLVYDLQIARSVSAQQRSLAHGSVFQITATAKPGHSAGELEEAIREELDRLVTLGAGVEELDATQTATKAVALKSLEPFSGVADRLNAYNHFLGRPDYLNEDLQRFSRVTTTDIESFVARDLSSSKGVVIHVEPGEKTLPDDPPVERALPSPAESGAAGSQPQEGPAAAQAGEPAPEPGPLDPGGSPSPLTEKAPDESAEAEPRSAQSWRFEVPEAGPAPEVDLPSAERFELDNGMPVYWVESRDLPLVTAQLTARSGSASDPPGMQGVTSFATAMMNEGVAGRNALEIANDLTAAGSTLATGSSKEGSWVVLQALTGKLDESMSIMSDVVLRPTFAEDELARVRNDRLVDYRQQADRPLTTAFKIMWDDLFGPDHPYGHLTLGSKQTVENVSRSDLVEAYRRTFGPNNAALFLTGDLGAAEARDLAERYFGSWDNQAQQPQTPGSGEAGQARLTVVDKPSSAQTSLVVAQPGISRDNPDFEQLQLVNRVLGRLFYSRLNQNLRQTLGYTYGVTSEITQTRGVGTLNIFTSVDTPVTGAAVQQILREVERMIESPVTAEELADARESLVQSLPAQFMTNASTASTLAHLYVMGLPLDYFDGLVSRLQEVTVEQVQAVAETYLRPDEMKVIAVGDRAAIEPQLQALRLGPVEYRTAEGELVTDELAPTG
ncbi:MAG: insulinase family protein [Actinomycetota bacterium]